MERTIIPYWINGNVRVPIMNMNLGHLKSSLRRLKAFEGKKFKGLDKAQTIKNLQEEITHRYDAEVYLEKVLKQRKIQKYNAIFKNLDPFMKIVESKLSKA